ncbi:MAG: PhnD/SsuA/transferrin family substrate-binding protein [Gammaproteobacteria bacterium]|nr:PhnD/SsuA/transferrin family substrate-binding protein [Gammaproteobacteria bacterium]
MPLRVTGLFAPIKELTLLRRHFLAGLALLPALPFSAHAAKTEFNIGIYPGTGKADVPAWDFRTWALPFAQALGAALDAKCTPTLFRSIKHITRSMEDGRMDLYFVPPSVAVAALDNKYSPVARVRDQATGVLVRRKGATVTTVALTEKESWLDVMARYTLKRNKQAVANFINLKTQEDVMLAMQRDYAQAGSLRSKLADELVGKGEYEIWYPLPTTPDFTLMASDHFNAAEQDKLGAAAVALSPEVIQSLQKTIHSKVTGFAIDKQADYKMIKQAIKEAGY